MANIAVQRIKREFKEVVKSEEVLHKIKAVKNFVFDQVARCHIKVELKNDSFTDLRGEIIGPPETPYEGGNYILDIHIPETYPFNPPKVKCDKIYGNILNDVI